jgi:hypothetical protein
MRKMRRTVAACVAVGLMALILPAAYAATTDNLVPTASYFPHCVSSSPSGNAVICQTDNAAVYVWFQSSVGSGVESTVRSSLDGSYDGTDLAIHYASSPVYSGTGETDIIYQVSTSGMSGSLIGFTWCDNAANASQCDQSYVRFKDAADTDRELACHETGHAVGLTHGAQASPVESNSDGSILGCMETPDSGAHPYLQSNNVDNINAVY